MPAAHHDDESLLTVQQVADWLQVEPRYVYRLASSGGLLRVYVGRYVRIPAASVRAYITCRLTFVAGVPGWIRLCPACRCDAGRPPRDIVWFQCERF